jgi:hypothetical protein
VCGMNRRKLLVGGGVVLAGVWEIAVNTDFIRSHLPKSLAMHSQAWIIALLIALILLLLYPHDEREHPESPLLTAKTQILMRATQRGEARQPN